MDQFRLDAFPAGDACPAPHHTDAPDDEHLARILAATRRVAIVGASPNPSRTSYQVAIWLMEHTPYELYMVNPAAGAEEIRGHGFYASLADLPVRVDMVDVFRRAEHTPAIAREAVEADVKTLFLQLGIRSDEAMEIADAAGIDAIQNRCLKVEYRRLEGRIKELRGE
ncbi:CoA-binding protein [Demequina lignilytica]|uniref:CoA-binding protein n=1 Tax=Demequina lignilytica TaxID=3051663 RepID=A0AB35MH54_9MICO|nr:CoA-binding protein [Demequina sp. SYSU T0a273]MDN4483116.1 CoA-binding protein [Demequina sp. SYSU T0a273]